MPLSYPLRKEENGAATLYSTSPGKNISGNASEEEIDFICTVSTELKDLFKVLGFTVSSFDYPLAGCLRLDWGYTWIARRNNKNYPSRDTIEAIVEAKLEEHIEILTQERCT